MIDKVHPINVGRKKLPTIAVSQGVQTTATNSTYIQMSEEMKPGGVTILSNCNQPEAGLVSGTLFTSIYHQVPSTSQVNIATAMNRTALPAPVAVAASVEPVVVAVQSAAPGNQPAQQTPQATSAATRDIGEQLQCGKWKCSYCSSTYKHKPHLVRHMITHTGEKPYACNFCNRRYFRKDNYEIHLKSHAEEKPFTCTYCNRHFLRKNNFERHVRLHTGEKPYACPYCLHRSIRKDTLEGHIYRNHTRDLKSIKDVDHEDDLSSSDDNSSP